MSALGQKQTLKDLHPMSALPPKADMVQRNQDVRFVPKADIGGSFDHLVGDGKDARWHRKAKCFCRFEVEHELEFSGLHHWQVGWAFATQDAARINARLPI